MLQCRQTPPPFRGASETERSQRSPSQNDTDVAGWRRVSCWSHRGALGPSSPARRRILAAIRSAPTNHRRRLELADGVPGWTLHDLRRTYRSLHGQIGTPSEIAERLINHAAAVQTEVEAIYDRWMYLPQMRKAVLAFDEHFNALMAARRSEPFNWCASPHHAHLEIAASPMPHFNTAKPCSCCPTMDRHH